MDARYRAQQEYLDKLKSWITVTGGEGIDESDKHFTVWKFHELSITQILREIKVKDSRSAKSAILTYLELLNFDFYEFLHSSKA